jgi:Hemerythrin HHE cation binding domain.
MEPDDLLADDHAKLDKLFEKIFVALRERDYERAFGALDSFWARLAVHIRAEHLHLFPALVETGLLNSADNEKRIEGAPSTGKVIEQLRVDHNFFMTELARVIRTVRLMLDGDNSGTLDDLTEVQQPLKNVRERLITHNDIEESRVYPLIESSLLADEAAEIRRKMKKELDNVPPRLVDNSETKDDTAA